MMKSFARVVAGALWLSTAAFAGQKTVIAKYGNWYQGDDDLYAQCLVLSDGHKGQIEYIFQGLPGVSIQHKTLPQSQFSALEKLRRPLPADSTLAPYDGYSFLQINESDQADFEVLGQAPGVKGNTNYDQYFSVSPASEAAKLMKTICNMEP